MIKAAFFDIDGTILSFKTHLIPESTKEALRALKAAGVACCIASGRPSYQFPPCIARGFEGFDGFDAFVTLTGSVCYDASGIYYDVPIDVADARAVVSQVEAGLYEALVLDADHAYVTAHTPAVCDIERRANLSYEEGDIRDALGTRVYQFCAFVPPEREHIVTDACANVFTTRWNDLFCDVVPKASSKPAGVRATLGHLGIDVSESIAFGDGGNDATMLEYCGVGVAMGNGTAEARAAADYVTDDVDHDGIANACRHFGLI